MTKIICGVCGGDLSEIFGIAHTIEVKGGTKFFSPDDPSEPTIIGKDAEAVLIKRGRTKITVHDCEQPMDPSSFQISF